VKTWSLVASATVASGLLAALVAHAEAPDGAASAAPPASAGDSAALDPEPLAREVPTIERSKAPTAAEWATARIVKPRIRTPRATACTTRRLREWIRVRCQTPTFAISLLGGSNEGLSFWIGGEAEGRFGEVQLPLRRGDRRVVQLWANESGVTTPSLVLQELWPEGDAAPTVTVL
jgi:hypothetical protein